MAHTKFYFDTRHFRSDNTAPLKLGLNAGGKSVLIPLNVYLSENQWDDFHRRIINHPQQQFYNVFIRGRKQIADTTILRLIESGAISSMSLADIKEAIVAAMHSGYTPADADTRQFFMPRLLKFANSKKARTKECYLGTYNRITAYLGDKANNLKFTDITREWLGEFDLFMAKTSPSQNAHNVHLRNIRAVFNEAIDDEVTTFYPFRRFKIRRMATPKRSLSVEELRTLFFNTKIEPYAVRYLDMFKLIFCLIGINLIDLCNLKQIRAGRVEYNRSKTGRLYSIKVEPEAMEIIKRYKGRKYLLNPLDTCKDHRVYMRLINNALQSIGTTEIINKYGKKSVTPLYPKLTTYWARHTWATIAAELDIPKETIAAALGHGGNTVTDIYIKFDNKKIDEANRRVIDYVWYGKK